MKKIERCIVHIGTEKTGTTSIQDYCYINRARLSEAGVLYPDCLGGANHIGLAALAQGESPKFQTPRLLLGAGGKDWHSFRQALLDHADQVIQKSPSGIRTLLFSNEHLHSNLIERSEVEGLREVLSRWAEEVTVIVYLRRQDLLAQSLYSTRIKGGEILGSEGIFPDLGNPAPYYFQYKEIIDNYAAVFGRQNVIIRIFEKDRLRGADLLEDFFYSIGVSRGLGYVDIAKRNESLSMPALNLLGLMNQHIPAFPSGVWNLDRNGLVELFEGLFSGAALFADRRSCLDFYQQFRNSNQEIVDQYLVGHGGTLFSEDFSKIPEEVPVSALSAPELAALVSNIWIDRARLIRRLRQNNSSLALRAFKKFPLSENRSACFALIDEFPDFEESFLSAAEFAQEIGDLQLAHTILERGLAVHSRSITIKARLASVTHDEH